MPDEQPTRIWTLGEARTALPAIRAYTEKIHEEVELILREGSENAAGREEASDKANQVLTRWASWIVDQGIHVKNAFLIDFDSGDGFFYCWQYPETEIEFFHLYEAGFQGRRHVSVLKKD